MGVTPQEHALVCPIFRNSFSHWDWIPWCLNSWPHWQASRVKDQPTFQYQFSQPCCADISSTICVESCDFIKITEWEKEKKRQFPNLALLVTPIMHRVSSMLIPSYMIMSYLSFQRFLRPKFPKNPTSLSSASNVNTESIPGSTPSSSPTTYYIIKTNA